MALPKLNLKNALKTAVPVGAGVIGANLLYNNTMVAGKLTNPKLRAGVIALLGMILSGRKGMIQNVGVGLTVGGLVKLASGFLPGIAAIEAIEGSDSMAEEMSGLVLNGPYAYGNEPTMNGLVLNGISGNGSDSMAEEIFA